MSAAKGETMVGRSLVSGAASGELLASEVPLSFMGGVDPRTGIVIDAHHPLHGTVITGRVLAIPSGRGSCSGSGVIFEMLQAGTGPAALIFGRDESILTLGVLIAGELLDRTLPAVRVAEADFAVLAGISGSVQVRDGVITTARANVLTVDEAFGARGPDTSAVALTDHDHAVLSGADGPAAQIALRLVVQAAALDGATGLVDVEQAHLDGVFYQGPGSLGFATTLRDLGARVRVPSTMNPLCVDRRRWRDQGVPHEVGEPAEQLADAYVAMGATPTYTCAPYCLAGRPGAGQRIGWAESNAVVYANSVLGARTLKLPDYLDLLIAITGRAPDTGAYRDEGRRATVRVDVAGYGGRSGDLDDAFYATLGHRVGELAGNDIPVVCGLETAGVSADDLKTFGAAFATTSAAPMFHVAGVTPEAPTPEAALGGRTPAWQVTLDPDALAAAWRELTTTPDDRVDLVALGNPHLSPTELAALAVATRGRRIAAGVTMIIACGREVHAEAERLGQVAEVERFGGTFVNDTCWCFTTEPVVPRGTRTILTNSAKHAHYGPGVTGCGFHLRGLAECVDAAVTGHVPASAPAWATSSYAPGVGSAEGGT